MGSSYPVSLSAITKLAPDTDAGFTDPIAEELPDEHRDFLRRADLFADVERILEYVPRKVQKKYDPNPLRILKGTEYRWSTIRLSSFSRVAI